MKVIIKMNCLLKPSHMQYLKETFLKSLDEDGMLLLPAGCEVIVLDKDDVPNIIVLDENTEDSAKNT